MKDKFTSRTRWRDKLEKEQPPRIVPVSPGLQKQFGRGRMLIPRPLDVDALVRKIRKGKVATVSQIRARLAEDAGADASCPLTTGIFLRIVAETAEEDRRNGKKRITPYWRVVRNDGAMNDKFPGGARAQAAKLRAEGHALSRAAGHKPPKLRDVGARLAAL